MTTIGVIGGGVLGHAIFRGFVEHAEVKVFDVLKEKATHSLEEAATCEIVFIALPTPAKPDGECDTLAIDDFLRTAKHEGWWTPESCYVIRSTVPVGYTQHESSKREHVLPLLHSPEFLTARCAVHDFQVPARNIIGMPGEGNWQPASRAIYEAFKKLRTLYQTRFPGVQVLEMDARASELVKLACNTFFGAKIQMFNMFAEIAKAAGVHWETVREGILSDGRIAHAHTEVRRDRDEIFPGTPGFGGACLPKDSADLYICGTALGVDCEIIREVIERNDRIRRPFDASLTQIRLPDKEAQNSPTRQAQS